MNKRKCKQCGVYTRDFIVLPIGAFCNKDHAILFAQSKQQQERVKARRKAEASKEIKKNDRGWLTKKAQAAFNAYIRARDKGRPCISCGRLHAGQIHAGHYKTTKAYPELRFHPMNAHAQCQPCNNHLSGNIIEYRKGLIDKIGIDAVRWIEGGHKPQNLTLEDLEEISRYYKKKFKEIDLIM